MECLTPGLDVRLGPCCPSTTSCAVKEEIHRSPRAGGGGGGAGSAGNMGYLYGFCPDAHHIFVYCPMNQQAQRV